MLRIQYMYILNFAASYLACLLFHVFTISHFLFSYSLVKDKGSCELFIVSSSFKETLSQLIGTNLEEICDFEGEI